MKKQLTVEERQKLLMDTLIGFIQRIYESEAKELQDAELATDHQGNVEHEIEVNYGKPSGTK